MLKPFVPEGVSTFSQQMDDLTILIGILGIPCLIVAEGILIYFVIRFRKRKGVKAEYIQGETWKQMRWVIFPTLFIVGLDFFIDIATSSAWTNMKINTPVSDVSVRVIGQQFNWQFVHPGKDGKLGTADDITTTNDLHVPVNKNIVFFLQAKDVLHGFFIPVLRVKQDAVPGRTWRGWFNATKVGKYDIACTEICGAGHTVMRATLHVHTQEEFDKWVEDPNAGTSLVPQDIVKKYACQSCHSLDGSRLVGPSWKGIYGKSETVVTDGAERSVNVDEAYLKKSIMEPKADVVKGYPNVMPSLPVSDAEAGALIKYIKELK
ncbi:MAG: cytochrome c oxidase subunit II [Spirochaetia bacterium]|nr:cytochrome c oxidase subunit II [Spirochaetia bacterium]